MDHTRLEPLKGKSRREPTAITKKTIKELLAEEGVDFNDMPILRKEPDSPVEPDQRVHDHRQLQPLKGKAAEREPTAVTKKTIQELLAEEGVDPNDVPLMRATKSDKEL